MFYLVRNKYIIYCEVATEKDFANIVFISRKNADLAALVVEFKNNGWTETAVEQIKKMKTIIAKNENSPYLL